MNFVEECINNLSGIRKLWLKVANKAEFSGQAEASVSDDSRTCHNGYLDPSLANVFGAGAVTDLILWFSWEEWECDGDARGF